VTAARRGDQAIPRRVDPVRPVPESGARHRPAAATGRSGSAAPGKRRDIQGLRTIAVVAVVVNHLTGHPRGGFVGVDIFFVISGYLITGLLVRDLGRGDGPVRYIANFYRRRVRRLMPAALVVIGATVLTAHFAFNATRFATTRTDGLWSAVFWANWHFASAGTDYFAASAPPSPLQHYWSLSVEEQFYVVWPVALFLLGLAVVRGQSVGRRRLAVGSASAVTLLVSLVYAVHQSTGDPTAAYFSTFARGWELALGALLACAVPYLRATRTVLTSMSWLGTALIGVSLFAARGGSGFPAPGAILPCVGSALVVAAVSNDGHAARNGLLTNRVSVFVGDMSYSIYLVHFPVVIMLTTYVAAGSTSYYLAAVTLAFALALGLYGLVEKPILESRWLLPTSAGRRAGGPADRPFAPLRWAGASVVLLVVAVGVAGHGPTPGALDAQTAAAIHRAAESPPPPRRPGTSAAAGQQLALTAKLQAALRAGSWPALHPSYDEVFSGPPEPASIYECGKTALSPNCVWGDAAAPPSRTIYLVGDSTSVAYDPAFRAAAALLPGWKVRAAGGFSCNFGDSVEVPQKDNFAQSCAARQQAVLADIRRLHPALLVLTEVTATAGYLASADRALRKIAGFYDRIVVLPAPPLNPDPRTCFVPSSSPSACVSRMPGNYRPILKADRAFVTKHHGLLIPTEDWFAVGGFCPPFVDHTPIKRDTTHITAAYSAQLGPTVAEAFRSRAGVR
jgi:peptidoglycan/LPS O-acetylase OafA/YrhL